MADFYLRFGDQLRQGIGQMANAGDRLLAADQASQEQQNELARFVERRAAARRQERMDSLAEMDRTRRIEEEDRLRGIANTEQERKDKEYQRNIDFMKWVSEQEGKGIDRDIAMREALGRGLLQPKDYLELTKPQQQRPDRIEPDPTEIEEIDGRKHLINKRTGEKVKDLGQITPKTSPKASENIKNKLQTLKLAKAQLARIQNSWKGIKGTMASGPKWTGQGLIPSQAGEQFDTDVEAFRQTMRSLTRTPGEGSMSDYEGKLALAALPTRGKFEGNTERQIENLYDMISLLENGYTGMQSEFEHPGSTSSGNGQVQEWVRDPATGKLRRK
jgi:hypothetical protein